MLFSELNYMIQAKFSVWKNVIKIGLGRNKPLLLVKN